MFILLTVGPKCTALKHLVVMVRPDRKDAGTRYTMAGVESQGGTPVMCTNNILYLKPISLV